MEKYEIPMMEVVYFEEEDVISTSGGLINGGIGDGDSGEFGDLFGND